ncbi:MAG TPA: response regulator [Thermoanaerobaculia bacterium]|nr:response regulator [Thermoanaerobaculia bacterium]
MEKPLVLLADDNEATCTLIQALLRSDFVVDVASDGREAIDKLKSRHYAAILLDLLMPVADGYAVLDHLTAERPDLLRRVLVVTASLSPRELQRVREYSIRAVIAKPFEVSVLQNAVRECASFRGEPFLAAPFLSGGMILLLADLLRRV